MAWRLLLASLRARRGRLALALMAVTVGVAVAIALLSLAIDVGDDLARNLRSTGPNFLIVPAGSPLTASGAGDPVPARPGQSLPESAFAQLAQSYWKNNLLAAAPQLLLPATLNAQPVLVIGTWFDAPRTSGANPTPSGMRGLYPHWALEGRWPHPERDEVALGQDLARRLDLHVGQRAALGAQARTTRVLVSAIVRTGGPDDEHAFAPLARTQAWSDRPGELDRIAFSALVRPAPRSAPPDPARDPAAFERFMCTAYPENVAREIEGRLNGADVLAMREVVSGEAQVVTRLNRLMALLALAALSASTLGLLATTAATVVERARELALMRALGASHGHIVTLLMSETLAIALLGGALGWGCGALAAAAVRGDAFGTDAAFHPLLLPVALALASAVAVVGTLGPLRAALRIEPGSVLRG